LEALSRFFSKFDSKAIFFMRSYGERIERFLLGGYFLWFGLIKVFGGKSASSIIAKSIYWIDPTWGVPALGIWEALIGLCLMISQFQRVAILLLVLRIPGVVLALFFNYHTCFETSILEPSIQGQYLIKQLTLIGAALVIGSSLKSHEEKDPSLECVRN
jgi:uncharacterized membrane protein YphA (DoxX/SURF4 family)